MRIALRALTRSILDIKNSRNHMFRHTFASCLLQTGADIVTVKELMGQARNDQHDHALSPYQPRGESEGRGCA